MRTSDRSYRRHARLISAAVLSAAIFGMILALTVLVFNPLDNDALSLVMLLFFGPLIIWIARRFKQAKARLTYARIDAQQYPDIHQLVQRFSREVELRGFPAAFLITDASTNPCAGELNTRPCVRIGSDFFAGCRENDTPEALEFMVAHQIAHLKAGHTSHWWAMVVSSVRFVPVLNALVARQMEFHADYLAARMSPQGAGLAIGLCQVGKDNFPYLNPEVQYDSGVSSSGFWAWIAKWSSIEVSPSERYARLVDAGLVPQKPEE
ncbi:hypothetical protein [Corynebacterium pelargi]|uniref:Protease HtpX n=1 Tax=Corynebacterium pelargi TaxID=1471400 RepID=A0A410WB45_9CORY|nr:hypothetical protein [Corynebacterium pelargi]QAU53198.1 Protease HtpX [Corynebacterium pelargi]GGG74126.1 hypothetical protein GCM10007338_09380 [Corynebacterium pelargi]